MIDGDGGRMRAVMFREVRSEFNHRQSFLRAKKNLQRRTEAKSTFKTLQSQTILALWAVDTLALEHL